MTTLIDGSSRRTAAAVGLLVHPQHRHRAGEHRQRPGDRGDHLLAAAQEDQPVGADVVDESEDDRQQDVVEQVLDPELEQDPVEIRLAVTVTTFCRLNRRNEPQNGVVRPSR